MLFVEVIFCSFCKKNHKMYFIYIYWICSSLLQPKYEWCLASYICYVACSKMGSDKFENYIDVWLLYIIYNAFATMWIFNNCWRRLKFSIIASRHIHARTKYAPKAQLYSGTLLEQMGIFQSNYFKSFIFLICFRLLKLIFNWFVNGLLTPAKYLNYWISSDTLHSLKFVSKSKK